MLKELLKKIVNRAISSIILQPQQYGYLMRPLQYYFTDKKEHSMSAALKEKIGPIKSSYTNVGNQQIQLHQTLESLSIIQRLSEEENKTKQFLLLRITCSNCKNRATRAFARIAYEKGVVMVKCAHCQHIHLIADHFGWFPEEQSKNPSVKHYDTIAIVKFIKKMFDQGFHQIQQKQK